LLVARFGEGLTRKAGAQDLMGRDAGYRYPFNIPRRPEAEIPFINGLKILIYLAGKNASMAETLQGKVEASEPRK